MSRVVNGYMALVDGVVNSQVWYDEWVNDMQVCVSGQRDGWTVW